MSEMESIISFGEFVDGSKFKVIMILLHLDFVVESC